MTEQGEIQPTPEEEKLLRAIFGEEDTPVERTTPALPHTEAIEELEEYVEGILTVLSPIEQRVMKLRMGLEDGLGWKPTRIAPEVGRAVSTVRKIEKRALNKLRNSRPSREYSLEDFLK